MDVLTENCPRYGVILLPQEVPLPIPPEGNRRMELEIGFGNGEYTVKYARAHPEVMLFGVEVSPACVLRCARRAGGLDNLRLIRADARLMMRELFAEGTLDKVTMNFPCPWPKRRHAHRRVTARDFADSLAVVLKQGGTFELVTDDEPYAQEARDRLGAHPALVLENFETNPLRPVTTKYERRWLAEGKSIYRLTFVKNEAETVESSTPARYAWGLNQKESLPMHIRTERPATQGFAEALNGVSGQNGEARWAFGRCYASPQGDALLLEVFSIDDEFEQRYYLRLSERDGGGLVQMDRTANAFLTPSVRGALRDVASRLS
ncbi:MAG: tRNA (guanosine(46)-N7)-methyltransferase TrmB [Fretibacterium sp.]|nr:tRNA (guanosine(46)-N7)-methyltransferase TrmB [Fretibacterium sp.]